MEHCSFDFYYSSLFQTYFIVFFTYLLYCKTPKQVIFNVYKYIWHLLPLCSTIINLLFSFNVEENHAIDVLREARQKQKTIQQMNSNENGNGSGSGNGNGNGNGK